MQDRIPSVLEAVAKDIAATRRFPESTYRLQFHAGFTFRDALHLVPYLQALGITHCYASPFLQARPGSTHGYDITNHQALNPEIGTAADYEALCETLQAHPERVDSQTETPEGGRGVPHVNRSDSGLHAVTSTLRVGMKDGYGRDAQGGRKHFPSGRS
jgi:hypothetical protein